MNAPLRYDALARALHWSMAAGLLAMLFAGAGMVASVSMRPALLALHVPLGLVLLALAGLRLWHRRRRGVPALPATVPRMQALAARGSHVALYALMFALPLLGWATLSASGQPILAAGFTVPAIAPVDPALYAWLRRAHGVLAWTLMALVVLHVSAALLHALVLRDGVFATMAGRAPAATGAVSDVPATAVEAPVTAETDPAASDDAPDAPR